MSNKAHRRPCALPLDEEHMCRRGAKIRDATAPLCPSIGEATDSVSLLSDPEVFER